MSGIDLIDDVSSKIKTVIADGAHDTRTFYASAESKGARVVVPPDKTATVGGELSRSRDRAVRRIRKVGRRQWKTEVGYHRQARVENAFFRLKTILGDWMRSRDFAPLFWKAREESLDRLARIRTQERGSAEERTELRRLSEQLVRNMEGLAVRERVQSVCVVDDDAAALKLAVSVMEASGHSAIGFTEPTKAQIQVGMNKFDLIILDLEMPERRVSISRSSSTWRTRLPGSSTSRELRVPKWPSTAGFEEVTGVS